jgi:hypothetical protein
LNIMGIIHKTLFDIRRCCSISGYRNALISLTLELFTLVTCTFFVHVNILWEGSVRTDNSLEEIGQQTGQNKDCIMGTND